jgi:hypothetical protein
MPKQNTDDAEQARRIRDAQLSQRDPGLSKIKGYDWSQHAKRGKAIQKSRQKPFLADLFDMMPPRWKGVVIGVAIGLIPVIAAQIFLRGEWAILGLVGLLVCSIIGFVVGAATQNDPDKK